MKHLKRVALAALAVISAVSYTLIPVSASAASGQSSALSIVPKKNYVIEPGQSVKDTLTISNIDSTSPLDLSLKVIDFTFTDKTGTPKLFLGNEPQTTWSLKPFLTVPESVTVPAGGSKTLDMSVAVPKNQGAGSYYSAIVYSSGAFGGGNVGLSASGVTLVFVDVPGKAHEDLKVTKLGAYSAADGYQYFALNKPDKIGYQVKNNGNVVESPAGAITMKDMWGHQTSINNVNPSGALALIGQERLYTPCIKYNESKASNQTPTCASPSLWPGLYTVSIDLLYGQNGNVTQEVTKTIHFWYLPWWAIVILILIIAAIVYGIWRLKRIVNERMYGPGGAKKSRRK